MTRNIQWTLLNSCYYLSYNRTLVGLAPILFTPGKSSLSPFRHLEFPGDVGQECEVVLFHSLCLRGAVIFIDQRDLDRPVFYYRRRERHLELG